MTDNMMRYYLVQELSFLPLHYSSGSVTRGFFYLADCSHNFYSFMGVLFSSDIYFRAGYNLICALVMWLKPLQPRLNNWGITEWINDRLLSKICQNIAVFCFSMFRCSDMVFMEKHVFTTRICTSICFMFKSWLMTCALFWCLISFGGVHWGMRNNGLQHTRQEVKLQY